MNSANNSVLNNTTKSISTEAINELKERLCFETEDINAYDKAFDKLHQTKELDEDSCLQKIYYGEFYEDAMEAAMMEDIKWKKFREENSNKLNKK